jgi:hypothetical protein
MKYSPAQPLESSVGSMRPANRLAQEWLPRLQQKQLSFRTKWQEFANAFWTGAAQGASLALSLAVLLIVVFFVSWIWPR